VINSHHFQSAWGPNKKAAEQKAALNALIELEIEDYSPDDKQL
jgi:dsRNA-specific ribonuclease